MNQAWALWATLAVHVDHGLRCTMIVLFTKYPVPGQVKTRLIPTLGADRAARLHRRFVETALDTARASGLPVTVCAAGAPLRLFRAWLGDGIRYERQSKGTLGRRMERAFTTAFRQGASQVIAIGADAPRLTHAVLRDAGAALDSAEVVLGPAADGGYYLIGMRRLHPALFRGIPWGSSTVLSQTRSLIAGAGLSLHELPVLSDVDRPDDIVPLRQDSRFVDALSENPQLAVIIPTLNEETAIAATIASAHHGRNVEIVVADGGSTDRTREIAQAAGAVVIDVPGGRAAQLNAGAAATSASRLLFLHADTRLSNDYESAIHAALDDPSVAAGAFRFKTEESTAGMRVVEWGTNLRSRWLQWPYGDQGLFLERRVFEAAGGFPSLRIMEDFELVRRLRRRGRVMTLPMVATTSARRWKTSGVVRVSLINQVMLLGYMLGVSDARLSRFYRNHGAASNWAVRMQGNRRGIGPSTE